MCLFPHVFQNWNQDWLREVGERLQNIPSSFPQPPCVFSSGMWALPNLGGLAWYSSDILAVWRQFLKSFLGLIKVKISLLMFSVFDIYPANSKILYKSWSKFIFLSVIYLSMLQRNRQRLIFGWFSSLFINTYANWEEETTIPQPKRLLLIWLLPIFGIPCYYKWNKFFLNVSKVPNLLFFFLEPRERRQRFFVLFCFFTKKTVWSSG